MTNWGRMMTAMVTPMNSDGTVNYDNAVSLAKRFESEGTTTIVVSGTTGESPTLTGNEKERLFKMIKDALKIPVIAGIGTNSTASSIENIKKAEACGVDGLLAVVPYYNKPNQDSIYAHFTALADASTLPIMLYNVPGRCGCNMDAKTSVALSKHQRIFALKEASGDLTQLAAVVRDTEKDFLVYTGDDAQILPSIAVGAYGVVSVASQLVGIQIMEMIQSYCKGDVEKATNMHLRLLGIFNKLFITSNPIPVKAGLNMIGVDVGPTRLPLAPASQDILDIVRTELKTLGLL